MKLKIKEFYFESVSPKPKWWQWVAAIVVSLLVYFKDVIIRILD